MKGTIRMGIKKEKVHFTLKTKTFIKESLEIIKSKDTVNIIGEMEESIKGLWVNNRMDGEGEFFWLDGKYFKGIYKKDKKNGKGFFRW